MMYSKFTLYFVICLAFLAASVQGTEMQSKYPVSHKFMARTNLARIPGIIHKGKASSHDNHEVVFAVKHKNLDWLKNELDSVSYPDSPSYGKHLTRQQIADKICDPEMTRSVREYLEASGFTVKRQTLYGEYIFVQGNVHQFEKLFATSFHEYSIRSHESKRVETVIRAEEYSIPVEIADYVSTVFNTVQFPAPVVKSVNLRPLSSSNTFTSAYPNYVYPQFIDAYYCIPNNTGNSLTTQAVYAALDQTMSPSDLSKFQTHFDLPQETIAGNYGGHVSSTTCNIQPDNCTEANLDVQYMMGTSQATPTYFFYANQTDIWLDWITAVADEPNPSDIFSISYSSYEIAFTPDYLDEFDVQAQSLGLSGTTILAAAGDDGVAGFAARDDASNCGYWAQFPASSPYVVAVGGTQGPESGNPEIVCQSNKGALITGGGGFSNYYKRPAYQETVVSTYLNSLTSNNAPYPGYNSTNRGYPDVSLLAHSYIIYVGGQQAVVDGTSASTPVFAGFLALVNANRKANGGSLLGWANPAIYADYSTWVNDITSGENNCCAQYANNKEICCSEGFTAITGWDPASGLGSVNFKEFATALSPGYEYSTYTCPTINGGIFSKSLSFFSLLIMIVTSLFALKL